MSDCGETLCVCSLRFLLHIFLCLPLFRHDGPRWVLMQRACSRADPGLNSAWNCTFTISATPLHWPEVRLLGIPSRHQTMRSSGWNSIYNCKFGSTKSRQKFRIRSPGCSHGCTDGSPFNLWHAQMKRLLTSRSPSYRRRCRDRFYSLQLISEASGRLRRIGSIVVWRHRRENGRPIHKACSMFLFPLVVCHLLSALTQAD